MANLYEVIAYDLDNGAAPSSDNNLYFNKETAMAHMDELVKEAIADAEDYAEYIRSEILDISEDVYNKILNVYFEGYTCHFGYAVMVKNLIEEDN